MVSARDLGWSLATAWYLLSKDDAHGPFPMQAEAIAASQRAKGSFGYGIVAPDLTFLFPQGRRDRQRPQVVWPPLTPAHQLRRIPVPPPSDGGI